MPFMGSSVVDRWLRKESASLDRLIGTLQTNMKRQDGMGEKRTAHPRILGHFQLVYQMCN